MATPYVFMVKNFFSAMENKLCLSFTLCTFYQQAIELVNRNFDVVQQRIFRLFFVIVKASVMQANCRSKKSFRVVFRP